MCSGAVPTRGEGSNVYCVKGLGGCLVLRFVDLRSWSARSVLR